MAILYAKRASAPDFMHEQCSYLIAPPVQFMDDVYANLVDFLMMDMQRHMLHDAHNTKFYSYWRMFFGRDYTQDMDHQWWFMSMEDRRKMMADSVSAAWQRLRAIISQDSLGRQRGLPFPTSLISMIKENPHDQHSFDLTELWAHTHKKAHLLLQRGQRSDSATSRDIKTKYVSAMDVVDFEAMRLRLCSMRRGDFSYDQHDFDVDLQRYQERIF